MFRANTISIITPPGISIVQGATVIKFLPALTINPRLGAGSFIPTPRKLRAASLKTAEAKQKVAWTITDDKHPGRMYFVISRRVLAPAAFT